MRTRTARRLRLRSSLLQRLALTSTQMLNN
nr:MAG TPA: hypothetical protein [Caudoviricetes sp.]